MEKEELLLLMLEGMSGWYSCLLLDVHAYIHFGPPVALSRLGKISNTGSEFLYLYKRQKCFGNGAWSSQRIKKIFSFSISSDHGV